MKSSEQSKPGLVENTSLIHHYCS